MIIILALNLFIYISQLHERVCDLSSSTAPVILSLCHGETINSNTPFHGNATIVALNAHAQY